MKALVDKRNKWKKGTSSIDETIWQAFLYYYLDEAQHPVTKCLEYTKMWAQESVRICIRRFRPILLLPETEKCSGGSKGSGP